MDSVKDPERVIDYSLEQRPRYAESIKNTPSQYISSRHHASSRGCDYEPMRSIDVLFELRKITIGINIVRLLGLGPMVF